MAITLTELFDKLKQVDEVSLLEILDISSEDIVDRFQDLIEQKYETLADELTEPEETGI